MQVLNWTSKQNRDKTQRKRAGRQPQGAGEGEGVKGLSKKRKKGERKNSRGKKRTQVLLMKFNPLAEKNFGRLLHHRVSHFLRCSAGLKWKEDQGPQNFSIYSLTSQKHITSYSSKFTSSGFIISSLAWATFIMLWHL